MYILFGTGKQNSACPQFAYVASSVVDPDPFGPPGSFHQEAKK
jgi:hypothetical protein